eukprot:2226831-Amphidinium_carterae.1
MEATASLTPPQEDTREAAMVASWLQCLPGVLDGCKLANIDQCSDAQGPGGTSGAGSISESL